MRRLSLRTRIFIGFVTFGTVVFIVVHTFLAAWLLHYVNNVLANIKGYQGSVQSIDIDLYRGAYKLNKLVINKKQGNIPTPFVAIDGVDLSLQWSALLHGRIVSSVTLVHPVLTFAVDKGAAQTGANVDWTQPIKQLMPIDINYVGLRDGDVVYRDFSSTPQVDIYVHHMDGEVRNLRNVQNPGDALPSTVMIKGSSIGNGSLNIGGHMNILKAVPDMDLLLSLENVDLPALNNYSEAYAAFDFASGKFSVYAQLAVKNNHVSGYVKPIASQLSVDVLKTNNPLEITWAAVLSAVLTVFTNPTKDQFATRVDLDGDLGNIQTDTWSTIVGIFSNAFVEAMSKGFDKTGVQPTPPAAQ